MIVLREKVTFLRDISPAHSWISLYEVQLFRKSCFSHTHKDVLLLMPSAA